MADTRPYYTLIVQYEDSWGQEFGDFDRSTVEVEAEEYDGKTVIHRSESVDDFASLNAKIADLNLQASFENDDFGITLC